MVSFRAAAAAADARCPGVKKSPTQGDGPAARRASLRRGERYTAAPVRRTVDRSLLRPVGGPRQRRAAAGEGARLCLGPPDGAYPSSTTAGPCEVSRLGWKKRRRGARALLGRHIGQNGEVMVCWTPAAPRAREKQKKSGGRNKKTAAVFFCCAATFGRPVVVLEPAAPTQRVPVVPLSNRALLHQTAGARAARGRRTLARRLAREGGDGAALLLERAHAPSLLFLGRTTHRTTPGAAGAFAGPSGGARHGTVRQVQARRVDAPRPRGRRLVFSAEGDAAERRERGRREKKRWCGPPPRWLFVRSRERGRQMAGSQYPVGMWFCVCCMFVG